MTRESKSGRDDEGWMKAFIVEETRVDEYVELYKSLGYEVMVRRVKEEDLDEGCKQCSLYLCERCRIIFIRKRE
jgi:hypothetical protein